MTGEWASATRTTTSTNEPRPEVGGAVMSTVLLVLSAALAVAVLVTAAVAWRRAGRLSPVAVDCVRLCLANLTVVAVTVAGPS